MNAVVARDLLLALQGLVVAILAVHDWLPLGRFNKTRTIRADRTLTQVLSVTAFQTVPFAFGLICSSFFRYTPYPAWLYGWLWISYGALFLGQVQSWWIPFIMKPYWIARGRASVTPNTLHLILHLATLATLVLLVFAR
ncbi:MAG TPA: hypothetical protein VMA98_05575 [Candidatus Acidoferrales bacterium]|nr:hypothetical protein [Candidatus Acidoferrales bacterium]